jgi:glycine oxidase
MTHPDITIIGAGIIGLAAAWRLSQRSLRVTVLERGRCGCGASSASLGVLSPHSASQVEEFHKLHRQSLDMLPAFAAELFDRTGIDLGYRQVGSLRRLVLEVHYTNAQKELEAAKTLWPGTDLTDKIQLLSPEEMNKLEPAAAPAEYGALFHKSTALVSVELFIAALQSACIQAGVTIRENFEVSDILFSGPRAEGIACGGEKIFSGKVLAAAGAWSSQLSPALAAYVPIIPVRGQALLLSWDKPIVRHIIKSERSYVVPWSENEFALGSTTELDAGFDEHNTFGGLQQVYAKTQRAVPAITGCRVKRVWAGLRPAGADRKLYLGPMPETEGLYAACGHYKIGFGFAPLTAEVLADLIVSGRSAHKIDYLLPRKITPKRGRQNG